MPSEIEKCLPLDDPTWPKADFKFGVAIKKTGKNQLHVSALFRGAAQLFLGDVRGHLVSAKSRAVPNRDILWVNPDIDQVDAEVLASLAEEWLDANVDRIPYSVASPGGVLFYEGRYVGTEPGQGLTCATFVVQLFKDSGFAFIDDKNWVNRDGDIEWKQRILELLRSRLPPGEADAQMNLIGSTFRVRPSDVAAAACHIFPNMTSNLEADEIDATRIDIEKRLLN